MTTTLLPRRTTPIALAMACIATTLMGQAEAKFGIYNDSAKPWTLTLANLSEKTQGSLGIYASSRLNQDLPMISQPALKSGTLDRSKPGPFTLLPGYSYDVTVTLGAVPTPMYNAEFACAMVFTDQAENAALMAFRLEATTQVSGHKMVQTGYLLKNKTKGAFAKPNQVLELNQNPTTKKWVITIDTDKVPNP